LVYGPSSSERRNAGIRRRADPFVCECSSQINAQKDYCIDLVCRTIRIPNQIACPQRDSFSAMGISNG